MSRFAIGIDVAVRTLGVVVLRAREPWPSSPVPIVSRYKGVTRTAVESSRAPATKHYAEIAAHSVELQWQMPNMANQWVPHLMETVDVIQVGGSCAKKVKNVNIEPLWNYTVLYLQELLERLGVANGSTGDSKLHCVTIERQWKGKKLNQIAMGLYVFFTTVTGSARASDVCIQSAVKKLEILAMPVPLKSVLSNSKDDYIHRKCMAVEVVEYLLQHWIDTGAIDPSVADQWRSLPWQTRRDPSDALLHVLRRLQVGPVSKVGLSFDALDEGTPIDLTSGSDSE